MLSHLLKHYRKRLGAALLEKKDCQLLISGVLIIVAQDLMENYSLMWDPPPPPSRKMHLHHLEKRMDSFKSEEDIFAMGANNYGAQCRCLFI